MAGRGKLGEVEPIVNNQTFMLRNGRWQKMSTPVNPDRTTSGISLAESFAHSFAKTYNLEVGLIPCADGGTCLDQWMPGELLYDNAVMQTKLAMKTSKLAGVLWHQGESDSFDGRHVDYQKKLAFIFESLRKDLNLSNDVPFLVGGLGDYLKDYKGKHDFSAYVYVNEALKSMAKQNDYISFVSAEGLTAYENDVHFTSRSLREFGNRYFIAYKQLNPNLKPLIRDSKGFIISDIEEL